MRRAARAQQGAGGQRLSDLRFDGARVVLLRCAAVTLWLDRHHRVGLPRGRRRGDIAGLGHIRAPAGAGVTIMTQPSPAQDLPMENLPAEDLPAEDLPAEDLPAEDLRILAALERKVLWLASWTIHH